MSQIHVFYQWVSNEKDEGTITGQRHDELCEDLPHARFILTEAKKHPPMSGMKLSYLIQKETVEILEKGKL